MKYINFRERKIAYAVEGKGPTVVLLHGFCEDSRVWEDFKVDLIEEKYRVNVLVHVNADVDSQPGIGNIHLATLGRDARHPHR